MDYQALWPFFGILTLQLAGLVLLPVAPIAIGSRVINRIHDARSPLSPGIETLSLVSGIYFGLALLGANLPLELFTFRNIFLDGGPWDLSYHAFLAERVNPFNYSLIPLVEHIYAEEGTFHVHPGLHFFALAFVFVVLGPIVRWRNLRALANGLRNLLIVVWATYVTIYLVCLLFWTFHVLNFWSFFAILLVVQYYRR